MTTSLHICANGLQVLLEENHSAPVISFNILVRVGSAMEADAEAGICHCIEHMLFKGTPTRSVGQIAHEVEAAGGEINAYTSFDQTVYYINMASRFADRGLDILADAVQHPLFDPTELTREAEVICEEIRREEDNPSHRIVERLFKFTYGPHPYGRPIIGSAQTVKAFTHDNLFHFWKKWYVAPNTTVIIVGDFETKTMLKKVETVFADISATPPPPMPPVAIPVETDGPTLFTEQTNIQSSYIAMGLPVPEVTHADVPALDILAHALAGGESSRLEQVLREKKQLVHAIHCFAYTPRGTGIFSIGATLQTVKLQKAVAAIWEEIARIHTDGITPAELELAKLNIRATETYEKESVGGLAAKYASFIAMAGDYTFEQRYYQAIHETTAEQVRDVARRYLTPARTTGMWLAPSKERLPEVATITAQFRLTSTPGKARPTALPKPVLFRLSNGLRVIVRENHRLPLVACCAVGLGGLRWETRENNGINTLITQTVIKGTAHRSALEIAQMIDALAGSIDGFTGRNTLGVRGEFLREKFLEGFALFAEILCEPSFPIDEVAKEKTQLIEAIHNQEDNLPAITMLQFARALYGRHPYGLRQYGEQPSVRRLHSKALTQFYHQLMHPKNLVVSLSGDVDVATVRRLVTQHLRWKPGRAPRLPAAPRPGVTKPVTIETRRADKQQAHIAFGFLTTTIASPDYYPLTVLSHILSGQGGRLFTKLRDQMSLAYAVSASHQVGIDPGFLVVYIGTEPGKVETAIQAIKNELGNLSETLVDGEEFERSRQYLVGTYELDRQRNGSLASSYAFNVLYGLGMHEVDRYPEKILKVTHHELLRVARKYLRMDHAICSIIRPQ